MNTFSPDLLAPLQTAVIRRVFASLDRIHGAVSEAVDVLISTIACMAFHPPPGDAKTIVQGV